MSIDASDKERHWARTKKLMFTHLAIWFVFAYVVHWFASNLNDVSLMGFPLGFYMAAQGSLAVFVVQLFVFLKQQERIDRECGMAEEE